MRTLSTSDCRHAPGPGDWLPADPDDVQCETCDITLEPHELSRISFDVSHYDACDVRCDRCVAGCSDCGGAGHEAGTADCPLEVA